jgi:hypothetical protein
MAVKLIKTEAELQNAQDELVLSVRQEAVAVIFGSLK